MTGLRIDVADLLTHPGSRRALELEVDLPGLAGSSARVLGGVTLDLVLERIPDGIVARGHAGGTWAGQCSEGLEDLEEHFEVTFDELFEPEPVEGETYPIEGREIDLTQLVRDTVLLELPLIPRCGSEHPEVHAVSDTGNGLAEEERATDPRWAALAELRLTETMHPTQTE